MEQELETRRDAGEGTPGKLRFWRQQLKLADKHEKDWRKRGEKVVERYRDESETGDRRFNILYANVEILKPAVLSSTPVPEVRRRYLDDDPVGREAAETLERALEHAIDDGDMDHSGFIESIEGARDDALLPGRGVARVMFDATIDRRDVQALRSIDGLTGEEQTSFFLDGAPTEPEFDGDGTPFVEEVAEQRVWPEYVDWRDVRFMPAGARKWRDVRAVAFRHRLTRADLVKLFGEKGRQIKLTDSTKATETTERKEEEGALKRAEVWEIWDAEERERLWISDGLDEIVDTEDDPLGLSGFFPMPEPLVFVSTNDSLIPVPEFTLYQDQARELDELSQRIRQIVKAIKVRGGYNGRSEEIARIIEGEENEIIPLDNFDPGVKLDDQIWILPIEKLAGVLQVLYQQREATKQEIFEVIGISDIIRGSSDARETAKAQQIKGNFGSLRMQPRQKPMNRFVRDTLRIMAELMAEHFTAEQLQRMTGRPVSDEVMQLLRDEKTRGFRIDIETDSTVAQDAESEKQQAIELVTAIGGFLERFGPLAQALPPMVPALMELLKFSLRRFKPSRTLEEAFDQATQQLVQLSQQPQQNPEAEAQMQKLQAEMEAMQAKLGMQQQESQAKLQLQAREQQGQFGLAAEKQRQDMAIAEAKAVNDIEIQRMRAQDAGQ